MTKIDIHTQSFLYKIVKPFYVYLERLELHATLKVIVTLFHSPLKITKKNYDNIIEREREREREREIINKIVRVTNLPNRNF